MQRTLSPDEIAAKKERRAQQAEKNAARYREEQQATLDKTARLRALRLAQVTQVGKSAKQVAKPDGEARGHSLELHSGARG
jgi:hypothetical protein